jgi:signal-transduction protein with cAMP-binding, CBS, and nucleotidyltransferase domain
MIETKKISDIMSRKIFTTQADVSVLAVVQEMITAQAEAAIVLSPDGIRTVGIFTERDLSRRVIGKGLDPAVTLISTVMTPDPVCLQQGDEIKKVAPLMLDRKFRHIPIKNGNAVVGIVSVFEMLKYLGEIYRLTVFSSTFI